MSLTLQPLMLENDAGIVPASIRHKRLACFAVIFDERTCIGERSRNHVRICIYLTDAHVAEF